MRNRETLDDVRRWATGKLAKLVAQLRDNGSCWEWTGQLKPNGYGTFGDGGAHRHAFRMLVGPVPSGMQVCHRCDNPVCCNPAHLFLGTAQDNSNDAKNKGRTNGGKPARPNFSTEVVAEVLRLAATERRRDIAARVGMTERNVYDILRRNRQGSFRPRGRQPKETRS